MQTEAELLSANRIALAHKKSLLHMMRTRKPFDDPTREQAFQENLKTALSDCDRVMAAADRDLKKLKKASLRYPEFVRRASWRDRLARQSEYEGSRYEH
jgi:hypothetical protein